MYIKQVEAILASNKKRIATYQTNPATYKKVYGTSKLTLIHISQPYYVERVKKWTLAEAKKFRAASSLSTWSKDPKPYTLTLDDHTEYYIEERGYLSVRAYEAAKLGHDVLIVSQTVSNNFAAMPYRHFYDGNIYQAEIGKARYKKGDTVSNTTRIPEFYKDFYLIEVSWSFGRLNYATGEIDHFFEVVRVETTPDNAPITPAPQPTKLQEIYRLYHPRLKTHFYSSSINERNILASRGWKNEGIAWKSKFSEGKPVYRLYHPTTKYHFYTINMNEYKLLGQRGWKQEGMAYRSSGNIPVYRLYHKGRNKYLFTRNKYEYTNLVTSGWKQEGIAWYAAE